jgi:hypothetical protein
VPDINQLGWLKEKRAEKTRRYGRTVEPTDRGIRFTVALRRQYRTLSGADLRGVSGRVPLALPRRKTSSLKEFIMGIGVSLILIAAGAILAFAIHVSTSSAFNLHTIGIILLVVGVIGALMSLMFWSSWGGVGGSRRETIVER